MESDALRRAHDKAVEALGGDEVMPGLDTEVLTEHQQEVPKNLTRIKPSMGRVVLTEIPPARYTDSGLELIYLREQAGNICKVEWVCDPYESGAGDQDASNMGPQFKPGDVVLIGKYNGIDVTLDRQKYILINESDVLGTLLSAEEG